MLATLVRVLGDLGRAEVGFHQASRAREAWPKQGCRTSWARGSLQARPTWPRARHFRLCPARHSSVPLSGNPPPRSPHPACSSEPSLGDQPCRARPPSLPTFSSTVVPPQLPGPTLGPALVFGWAGGIHLATH
jgi:hypothetical protein